MMSQRSRKVLGAGLMVAGYAALAAYYRFRPQPEGINGPPLRTYRVPVEDVRFLHDTTWYLDGEQKSIRCITDEVVRIVREARKFVVMDIFLFNLHHAIDPDVGPFVPTTRQIAEAFAARDRPGYFITDPLNTSYGTAGSEPLEWLRAAGVEVCFTNLAKLRDPDLLYSPLWRLFIRWWGGGRSGVFPNPQRQDRTTTARAFLMALNGKSNHRKVVIADEDEDYVTLVTSSNFEDSSSYFCNVALRVRSRSVSRHFLEAERAMAAISGCHIPVEIPPGDEPAGEARVTPLMGTEIRDALLADLRTAGRGDEIHLFQLFLSHRGVIEALVEASRRGAEATVVLDQNKTSFGNEKAGYPNQVVAAELLRRSRVHVRMANTHHEEFHTKLLLVRRGPRCVMHLGTANFNRRSLSDTNAEANLRVDLPLDAPAAQEALSYVRWAASAPRSVPAQMGDPSRLKYLAYRFMEATGSGTF